MAAEEVLSCPRAQSQDRTETGVHKFTTESPLGAVVLRPSPLLTHLYKPNTEQEVVTKMG